MLSEKNLCVTLANEPWQSLQCAFFKSLSDITFNVSLTAKIALLSEFNSRFNIMCNLLKDEETLAILLLICVVKTDEETDLSGA